MAWTGLGALASLAGLAACTQVASPAADPAWQAQLDVLLADATAGGASDSQVEALQRAKDDGLITFEVYADSVGLTQACLEESGLSIDRPVVRQLNGVDVIQYGWGGNDSLSEDQTFAIFDECQRTHSLWVESAYLGQPSSLQARDAIVASFAPALLECLGTYGVELGDDAAADEIANAIGELLGPDGDGPNCTDESGLNDALNGITSSADQGK